MEGNAATEDTTTSAEHDGLVFAVALDGLADRLARQVDDIETIRERTQIMQDEILNHLATQSNRIMYLLAVVATVFLPISFLTGLFGVNLGVIPERALGVHRGLRGPRHHRRDRGLAVPPAEVVLKAPLTPYRAVFSPARPP